MELNGQIRRVNETLWEIDRSYKEGMRVPARIYGTEKLIREMDQRVIEQSFRMSYRF